MPSRRSHTKTRHGCSQCKRKRIRCDLNFPRCYNCRKRGLECEERSSEFSPSSAPVLHGGAISTLTNTNCHVSFNLRREEIDLLRFYSTSTAVFFSDRPTSTPILQFAIPNESIGNDFLMHQLLALSASHLTSLHPEQRAHYEPLIVRHQNLAISSYIPALNNIGVDNCHALFACSTALMLLSFAFPQLSCAVQSLDPIDGLVRVFQLQKGVAAVLNQSMEVIRQGSLGPLLAEDNEPFSTVESPPGQSVSPAGVFIEGMAERLDGLARRNATASPRPAWKRGVHTGAIDGLKRCYNWVRSSARTRQAVLIWPIQASGAYLRLISQRQPLALATLLVYAVLLHHIRDSMWSPVWGRQTVRAIVAKLGQGWEEETQWALRMTQGPPKARPQHLITAAEADPPVLATTSVVPVYK